VGSERDERGNLNQLMSVLRDQRVADVPVGDPLILTPRLAYCNLPDGVALYPPEVAPRRSGSVSGFSSVAGSSP